MGGDVRPVPGSKPSVQWSEGLVNDGNNYNSLKVAKYLVVLMTTRMSGVTRSSLSLARVPRTHYSGVKAGDTQWEAKTP